MTELSGPKILLEGPSGSGKTRSLGTLAEWAEAHNKELFIIFSEPNGLETLLGYFAQRNKAVPACVHWHLVTTPSLGLDALINASKDTAMLSYEALSKKIDPNRGTNNPWEKFLRVLTNVPCDRTGKTYGNIGEWDTSRILAIDTLTETANACWKMVIGNKLTASPPEYMVAQNNLINWLRYMTQALKCTFVITAHVERQINEVTGQMNVTTKTGIGKALANDIPQLFSEVILTVRDTNQWYWDLAAPGVDTKTRYLSVASKITPDFSLIMNEWEKRSKLLAHQPIPLSPRSTPEPELTLSTK